MRSFTTVLVTASLVASALAGPLFDAMPHFEQKRQSSGACMTDAEAQQVATTFQTLIANYSDTLANNSMTTGFTDFSDSVTSLIDGGCTGPQPLGAVTFPSRAAFEKGQGGQPAIPFEQLNMWHNCDNVFLRWRSLQSPEMVTGIIIIETTPAASGAPLPWLINTVYSEFNSGAWLVNLGVFTPANATCAAQAH